MIFDTDTFDRNGSKKRFFKMFFGAYDDYMNADITKKSYAKKQQQYHDLVAMVIRSYTWTLSAPDVIKESIDEQWLALMKDIHDIYTIKMFDDADRIVFMNALRKKFAAMQ